MTIKDLKLNIINNCVDSDLIIFVCSENTFLANQYVEEISTLKHLQINNINSLVEINNSALSLVFDFDNQLNVLRVDTFEELLDDYSSLQNCIVVCNKVDKKIEPMVKNYIIEVPKLLDWQIKAYIQLLCRGLEQEDIDWLYEAAKHDIYKCESEAEKISQFKTSEQKKVLYDLKYDTNTDLFSTKDDFEVIEAILRSDKLKLIDILSHRKCCNLDPFFITSNLLTRLKRILYLNYNSGLTADSLGISSGQAWHIRNDYKNCSEKFLIEAIDFLSSIDNKIKNGELELDNDSLTDFIICHLLNFY